MSSYMKYFRKSTLSPHEAILALKKSKAIKLKRRYVVVKNNKTNEMRISSCLDVGEFKKYLLDNQLNWSFAIGNSDDEMVFYFRSMKYLLKTIPNLSMNLKIDLARDDVEVKSQIKWLNKRRKKICAYGNCTEIRYNKKCKGCGQKYYCSRKHQKKHWKKKHRLYCLNNN